MMPVPPQVAYGIDLNRVPTTQKLADDVVEEWRENRDEPDFDLDIFVEQAAAEAVPCMTTLLFAMVLNDNSLAFVDGPEETAEPFRCLSQAVQSEVASKARATIDALVEEGGDG